MQTLILNHYMRPHRVCSWQDAITELFTDKIEILDWYDEVIYQNAERGITMRMPAVGRLLKPIRGSKRRVRFSGVNVMVRDQFTCQYCGRRQHIDGLNKDHVVPRSHGGKTEWNNIVTSCLNCNSKKGARTPEQAGMRLLREPFKPKNLPLELPGLALRRVPEQWQPYVN